MVYHKYQNKNYSLSLSSHKNPLCIQYPKQNSESSLKNIQKHLSIHILTPTITIKKH